jgi:hypothetical protein
MLFFDAALLALGNVRCFFQLLCFFGCPPLMCDLLNQILFISGVMLIIGLKNTGLFFWRRMRGSVCFIGGMLLVLFGWPIFGMMLEIFGIINLFANFFPLAFTVLQGIPCFAWVGRLKPAYEKVPDDAPSLFYF